MIFILRKHPSSYLRTQNAPSSNLQVIVRIHQDDGLIIISDKAVRFSSTSLTSKTRVSFMQYTLITPFAGFSVTVLTGSGILYDESSILVLIVLPVQS